MSIKVKNLRKKYGKGEATAEVLKGIDFEVKDGEILTVLGPSGSGKSTLLNLLGGLDQADGGSIEIDGTDLTGLSAGELTAFRRNKFGFVYQFYNLISDLNVYENVEVCQWLGDRSIAVEDMLKQVGMWEHKDKFPHELSGGMQQRVSIARALSKNPAVLFCDEPTGALDYKSAHDVLNVIEQVHLESHATVILVTHNRAIADMSDHVIEIKDGRIAEERYQDHPLSASEVEW